MTEQLQELVAELQLVQQSLPLLVEKTHLLQVLQVQGLVLEHHQPEQLVLPVPLQ